MRDQIKKHNAIKATMTKKIKNWPAYNRALIQRGNIAIWLSDDAIQPRIQVPS
ncbi:hypothetical protein N475_25970, partial [Pseudoalteromonas luteoviolacea DSM 6061]